VLFDVFYRGKRDLSKSNSYQGDFHAARHTSIYRIVKLCQNTLAFVYFCPKFRNFICRAKIDLIQRVECREYQQKHSKIFRKPASTLSLSLKTCTTVFSLRFNKYSVNAIVTCLLVQRWLTDDEKASERVDDQLASADEDDGMNHVSWYEQRIL